MTKKALIALVLILICVRMVLPSLILPPLNRKLATMSDAMVVHIDDLDLGILLGRYRFEGLSVRSKTREGSKGFLRVDGATVSLAWRELFRGRIVTDVRLEGLDVVIGPELSEIQAKIAASKDNAGADQMASTLVPFEVDRVLIDNSRVGFENEYLGEDGRMLFTNINGRLTHLSNDPDSKVPTLISLKADLLGTAALTATGKAFPFRTPVDWDLRLKLVSFDLTKANGLLKKMVPLTFTSGSLEAFSEIKSEGKEIEGYVKPFFEKVDVIANREHFEGIKHFGVELGSAFGNLLLRERKEKSTAAVLDFTYGKDGLNFKFGEMLKTALKNGFGAPLQKDFENKNQLELLGSPN